MAIWIVLETAFEYDDSWYHPNGATVYKDGYLGTAEEATQALRQLVKNCIIGETWPSAIESMTYLEESEEPASKRLYEAFGLDRNMGFCYAWSEWVRDKKVEDVTDEQADAFNAVAGLFKVVRLVEKRALDFTP